MISIAFTGDIAFSKHFNTAYENQNLLSDKIIDFLSNSNYTVANVEAPVTLKPTSAVQDLVHVSHPRIVETLKKINGNVWNLANNHSMDCGEEGLKETIRYATESGAQTIGAGLNVKQASKPLVLEKDGVKVGIVSLASELSVLSDENNAGCFSWADFKRIKAIIEKLKQECDYCTVVVHGGEEFSQIPLPYAREKYKKYLKFGADVVVGHHPHVTQNYETFGNKVVFYSLGNFIFDTDYQRSQKNTEKGVLIKIDFDKEGFKWKNLCIKIDRQAGTVKECEPHLIFTNICAKEYNRLIPFADLNYSKNLLNKYNFLGKTNLTCTKHKFFKAKLERFQKGERAWVYKMILLRPFKAYKKVDKNLVEYIKNS